LDKQSGHGGTFVEDDFHVKEKTRKKKKKKQKTNPRAKLGGGHKKEQPIMKKSEI